MKIYICAVYIINPAFWNEELFQQTNVSVNCHINNIYSRHINSSNCRGLKLYQSPLPRCRRQYHRMYCQLSLYHCCFQVSGNA